MDYIMTKAEKIYSQLTNRAFSYGESVSMILDEQGKPLSTISSGGINEDYVFSDNSVIRVSNNGVSLLEYLTE
jgi:hypothetical protein